MISRSQWKPRDGEVVEGSLGLWTKQNIYGSTCNIINITDPLFQLNTHHLSTQGVQSVQSPAEPSLPSAMYALMASGIVAFVAAETNMMQTA
jgi:hypothetical protein